MSPESRGWINGHFRDDFSSHIFSYWKPDITIFNLIAASITREEHEDYTEMKADPSEEQIHDLANKFSEAVLEKVIQAPYVPGAYEFISENHSNYDMYISTATPQDEIEKILLKKGLRNFFKAVYGAPWKKD